MGVVEIIISVLLSTAINLLIIKCYLNVFVRELFKGLNEHFDETRKITDEFYESIVNKINKHQ